MNNCIVNIDNLKVGTLCHQKIKNNMPSAYRLAQKQDGTLILQGMFQITEGLTFSEEWEEIPIVQLP